MKVRSGLTAMSLEMPRMVLLYYLHSSCFGISRQVPKATLLVLYLDSDILSQTILCLFTVLLAYSMGKIVNKQRIVCDRISESRYIRYAKQCQSFTMVIIN